VAVPGVLGRLPAEALLECAVAPAARVAAIAVRAKRTFADTRTALTYTSVPKYLGSSRELSGRPGLSPLASAAISWGTPSG